MLPSNETIARVLDADMVCVDIETKDPELKKKGPGTKRKDGYVCGVGFGIDPYNKFYLPFNHPDVPEETRQKARGIATDLLQTDQPKIGANFIYDLEWLTQFENFKVGGKAHDIQYAEPLLNEYKRSYSLDNLAKTHGVGCKASSVLKDYNDMMGWKGEPIANLWRMPWSVVKDYAEMDVELPISIFEKQKISLERQNLWDLYLMETDLIPLLLQMREVGVRIDVPKLEQTSMAIADKHFEAKEKLFEWAGFELNLGSTPQLAKVMDRKGIKYPRNAPTELMRKKGKPGNPNLDKDALEAMAEQHPVANDILKFRHYETIINMFLHPYLDFKVDDRLYGTFHPLKSDEYGTVAGRFSASKPNLQQVSAKKEEGEDDSEDSAMKGRIIRSLFVPEEGMQWAKLDYSQIEYRIIAHYATGRGSEELREQYRQNSATDFHKVIQDLTNFDRRTAKRLNFGGAYGMGVKTTARKFKWTMDDAELFMRTYHNAAPYIKKTRKAVANAAKRKQFIFTLLNRRARVHSSRKLHSMFNRLIQGSAADIMKKAMVDAYQAGIFETLVPHMTVHDEMDVSYVDNAEGNEALKELTNIMETAVPLDVPVKVDCHTGANWEEAD